LVRCNTKKGNTRTKLWKNRARLEQIYYRRKANQVRQAYHAIFAIILIPPLCPLWVVEKWTCSPNSSTAFYLKVSGTFSPLYIKQAWVIFFKACFKMVLPLVKSSFVLNLKHRTSNKSLPSYELSGFLRPMIIIGHGQEIFLNFFDLGYPKGFWLADTKATKSPTWKS
jgi:hypothetical protein